MHDPSVAQVSIAVVAMRADFISAVGALLSSEPTAAAPEAGSVGFKRSDRIVWLIQFAALGIFTDPLGTLLVRTDQQRLLHVRPDPPGDSFGAWTIRVGKAATWWALTVSPGWNRLSCRM